ncbi:hypothetical protein [uncultured Microbacterium sp.]|uniref:hypothetical protein n=1 Tax=uncultured Microbacterium sp. TaxID=191216 RepID=UPI0025FCFFE0|nr:hypothetical protein [uncultured Microbacterium sp.]
MSKRRWAEVASEIGGPAQLLTILLLEVGWSSRSLVPTITAVVTMGVIPYGVTVWLARTGRVSDRFVRDRRQRTPILLGTLGIFVLGGGAVWLMGSPAPLRALVVVAGGGLVVVTLITVFWKVSVHATLAAFFAAMQIVLFGGWGAWGLVVLAAVLWARKALSAHSVAQLVAGTILGCGLAVAYRVLESALTS